MTQINTKAALMLAWILAIASLSLSAEATAADHPAGNAPATVSDGQRDFDFEIGTWCTVARRRLRPLTGSSEWVELKGITTVRKVWNGRGNLVELEADGPGGHFQGLSLRLYNPETQLWSLNFASSHDGVLSPPTVGQFKNGRGEFFGLETFSGRPIFVRFVISNITATSCRFEQAFSDDGGKTWEVNWIAEDTRIAAGATPPAAEQR